MELINLHKLESTMVHFFTSIKGNGTVITKMMRYKEIKKISDEHDVLDNIFIENQQNLEMTQIYKEIISSTRDLFSSIIDSRLYRYEVPYCDYCDFINSYNYLRNIWYELKSSWNAIYADYKRIYDYNYNDCNNVCNYHYIFSL